MIPGCWKGWCSPVDSEARMLGSMDLGELRELYGELAGDRKAGSS